MDVIWKCQGRGNDAMRLAVVRMIAGLLVLAGFGGCSVLPKPEPVAMDQYVLEYTPNRIASESVDDMPVLIVTAPRAHGGYDTHRIAYMKQEFSLRYYTRSRWADTPARMLAPLTADAMQATGQFMALYAVPGSIAADYRLDTELIRFHQDFTRQPSVMHITLRAQLVDLRESRVVGTQQFDIVEAAATEDSYGGVVAANKAVSRLLNELALFCVSGAGTAHSRK
jgi:cholesterol transport system auxiliary component